jgi:hypothetical protein
MFSFLKRKTAQAVETVMEKSAEGRYSRDIEQIHHEFETAGEELLKSAKEIITEAASKDTGKVSRLQSLGFKQSVQVTELKPLLQKAELSKEQVELVNYYAQHYPNNKFITEDQVKAICHKYNLVCGDVDRFRGFVPEKNLRQIESFKLKNEDRGLVELVNTCCDQRSLGFYKESELPNVKYIWAVGAHNIGRQESAVQKKLHDKALEMGIREEWIYIQRSGKTSETLQICAPVKDMDITGLELVDGYRLRKHIPDPVVLQIVRGGYLILTAWGDEASDEIVVNQKMN